MEADTRTVREAKHDVRVGATLDVNGFAMTLEPGK
jgi:hypothetical protein